MKDLFKACDAMTDLCERLACLPKAAAEDFLIARNGRKFEYNGFTVSVQDQPEEGAFELGGGYILTIEEHPEVSADVLLMFEDSTNYYWEM